MIERDPRGFTADRYDVIVVGGGIYGVMVTLEAARRGLRPLLVERGDFGAETSANSLRIVHGGLRYLQTMDLGRFRDSVRERSWFLEAFPDLVRPLTCLMPLYGEGLRRTAVLRPVLALNDGLAALSGNRGPHRVGRSRVVPAAETRTMVPGLPRSDRLEGAALWQDGAMEDSERVVIEALRWACRAGARALNYVEATGLSVANGAVEGIRAVDRASGETVEYRSPAVVNAAGPWVRDVSKTLGSDVPELGRSTMAFNVAFRVEHPPPAAIAVAPWPSRHPVYFVVPWKGGILAGTHHSEEESDLRDGGPTTAQLDAFRARLASAAPFLGLESAEMVDVRYGFLPGDPARPLGLAHRPAIVDHARRGGPRRLVSVFGVKFTTARSVAEDVLRRLWGADLPPPRDVARPEPSWWPSRQLLDAPYPVDRSEVVQLCRDIIRRESVVTEDDLVRRRIGWNPFTPPLDAAVLTELGLSKECRT